MRVQYLILGAVAISLASCSTNKAETDEVAKVVAFDTNMIDHSIDPCDNFYKYAIGTWQENNPVPSTESRWMAFNILDKENKKKLQGIIDELVSSEEVTPGSEAQMIRDFYKSAMDTSNLKIEGLQTIQAQMDMLDVVENKDQLMQVMNRMAPLHVTTAFSLYVSRDRKNSDKYSVGMSQIRLSLPDRDYYLRQDDKNKEARTALVEHIAKMFELAGYEAENPGERILNLETKLAMRSWPRVQLRNPDLTYNKKSVQEWDAEFENINLIPMLEMRGLSKADSLNIGQPSFFYGLDSLLANESIEDWKLWMKWNMLNAYSTFLGDQIEKESFAFYGTTLRGTKEMKPRKERILAVLNGNVGQPLGKLYVEKYFPAESKKYMEGMIENLRSAYRDRIKQLDWMSDETKEKALRKLEAFTYKIGYPDEWDDYSELEISSENYIQNVMNSNMWEYNDMTSKLGQPVDEKEWFMLPQMVNAYYSSSGNEVVFPAGILQPPFFHPDFDHAINYGAIGAVIGHEFTHGFDDQGSKYDWDGNLNNWWTEEDRTAFEKLAGKLAAQYSSYNPIDTMHVNGRLTLGENIADLGGVTLAYEALKKQLAGNEPDPIDGYTWQQRFFLGWANVWKGNINDEELRNRLLTDPHSPAEYRGNGPLVNFDPFYDAFGACEEGKMYKPVDQRIRIW